MRPLRALISKKTMHRAHVSSSFFYAIRAFEEDEDNCAELLFSETRDKDNWIWYITDYEGLMEVYPFKDKETNIFKYETNNEDELLDFIEKNRYDDLAKLCKDPKTLI